MMVQCICGERRKGKRSPTILLKYVSAKHCVFSCEYRVLRGSLFLASHKKRDLSIHVKWWKVMVKSRQEHKHVALDQAEVWTAYSPASCSMQNICSLFAWDVKLPKFQGEAISKQTASSRAHCGQLCLWACRQHEENLKNSGYGYLDHFDVDTHCLIEHRAEENQVNSNAYRKGLIQFLWLFFSTCLSSS